MRLLKPRCFLTGGVLVILVLGGAALAQPTPGDPAYEMGVVLIQYDEVVYTAHLEDLVDDLLDKLPGGLGGFVGDQSDVDIPLRPVGVVDDLLRTNGFPLAEVIARLDSLQTEAIDVGAEVDPHDVIDLLKDFFQDKPLAGVLHAQPNFIYQPLQTSAAYTTDQTTNPDPSRLMAWHLKAIQLKDAWDEVWVRAADRPTGAGPITIGILDTGVDFSNRELAGKKWSKTNNGGQGFVGFPDDVDPSPGPVAPGSLGNHGTWVAGVAAGEFNNGYDSFGVAQDVELVSIRVYDPSLPLTTLDVVQGVDFARHNQLDIINVSLGRSRIYRRCTDYSLTSANSLSLFLVYQALQAYPAGLFTTSAGNYPWESGGVDTVYLPGDFASDLTLKGQQCWPGLDNVMQVGGTELDQANNRERIWENTTYGAHIDIATGAKDIPTVDQTRSGTSYAAPQVAGVAALMLMVNPTLTPSELKAKLRDSADILEDFDGLDAAGNVSAMEENLADGRRLNAYRAVKLALGETTFQIDPLPEIVANTDAFTSAAPLVLREQGLYEAGGWEITHTAPGAVASLGGAHNDRVSSLIIADGYTVEVFRNGNYTGARWTYVGPQTADLAGSGLNNQLSSYKLYATPASYHTAPLVLRDQGVNGVGGWEIVHTGPVAVGWIGGPHNDRVSSLRIGAGYTVEVFRDWAFGGPAQTFVGPQAVGLGAHGLNNQLSSYKVYATPTLLTLREQGLGDASGWEITHNAPVAVPGMGWHRGDKVSSLVIQAGYTVEVFRHGTYTGARLTYVGPQSVDLTGTSLDNQISSYKFYVTPTSAVDEVLVLREQGLNETGGWEIAHNDPVAVPGMGWGDGDKVSSLIIGAGYTVEVFRHGDYRGARLTYVGPQEVDLAGTSLDNQISSYKLYSTPPVAVAEVLVLWERGLNETGGWEIAHTDPVEVPGMGWEDGDKVSSLTVAAGYTVEVFRHGDYRGARLTYVGPQEVDLAGTSLNNQISSYKLYSTPPVPVAEALVLRERGLNETGGWEIGHNAPVAVPGMGWEDGDKVSSLIIGAGYTVEVFRHGTYTGTAQTYVGPQSVDLTGNTLDNQISSYKLYVTP